MRISDWSSDVCSSDLPCDGCGAERALAKDVHRHAAIARIGKRRATDRRPRRDSRYAAGRGIGDHVDGLIEARGTQIVVARIPDVAMASLIIGTPLSAIEKASFERHPEPVLAPMVAGSAGVAAGVVAHVEIGSALRGARVWTEVEVMV